MANIGFFCLDGYLERLARLSDAEVGRVFRACMLYHKTGEVADLNDREGMAFDFIRADIDAAGEKYRAKCEKNRENVEKRWGGTSECDRIRPNTDEYQTIRPYTTEAKENININIKENEKDFIDVDNAREIQADHDRVLDAAEDAGFKMSNDVRAALISLYADHGLQKVLDGLRSCVEHGAPHLAYLKAVLRGEPRKPPGKTVPAQQYGQRDYSSEQDEAMARMLSMMGGADSA